MALVVHSDTTANTYHELRSKADNEADLWTRGDILKPFDDRCKDSKPLFEPTALLDFVSEASASEHNTPVGPSLACELAVAPYSKLWNIYKVTGLNEAYCDAGAHRVIHNQHTPNPTRYAPAVGTI